MSLETASPALVTTLASCVSSLLRKEAEEADVVDIGVRPPLFSVASLVIDNVQVFVAARKIHRGVEKEPRIASFDYQLMLRADVGIAKAHGLEGPGLDRFLMRQESAFNTLFVGDGAVFKNATLHIDARPNNDPVAHMVTSERFRESHWLVRLKRR